MALDEPPGVTPHGLERDCPPRALQRCCLGEHSVRTTHLSSALWNYHQLRRDLLNRFVGYFQRRGLDGLAGWFGREFHRLLSEGIDAAPSFRGWFIDHRHFDESRNYKLTGFIQLLVANRRQVFHDGLHVVL